MKRNIFIISLYALTLTGLPAVLFIIYKDIETSFTSYFVVGYAILLLFTLLVFLALTGWGMRKLKWNEIRKRLIKFATLFLILLASSYLGNHFFRPEREVFPDFGIPLGIAFSASFLDLMFSGKRKE